MRVAICDDEQVQLELLEKYLSEWGKERSILIETSLFLSGESFLFSWEEDKAYDLLILDIEMGKINGMELAGKLRRQDEDLPILFITGYDSYMAQGYEVSALHYLLKPVQKEKLFAVLDRLQQRERKKKEEKILFQTEEGQLSLPISNIWYIEASAHQSTLYTQDEEHILRHSISAVEKQLEGKKEMIRCHRSYLVNLWHISAIIKNEIILDNKKRLPVSRSLYKEVNAAFIRNYH